jgi:putative toxin-antitoxin system antitoxin component (TIGR02293 family)
VWLLNNGEIFMGILKKSIVSITTGVSFSDTFQLIQRLQKGLSYTAFERLEKYYNLPRKEFLMMIGLSTSTLQRRKIAGKMSIREGERIVHYAHLLDLALALMEGNESRALQWLKTPARALDGETPLDYAFISFGAQQVEYLIGQIEHGVVI